MKAITASLLILLIATPASAQNAGPNICGDRGAIIERLQEVYGETFQALGLQRNQMVMEIFANADTGTWTVLVADPWGGACIVAAGQAWSPGDPTANLGDPT